MFGRSARTVNGWVREECCGADMMQNSSAQEKDSSSSIEALIEGEEEVNCRRRPLLALLPSRLPLTVTRRTEAMYGT